MDEEPSNRATFWSFVPNHQKFVNPDRNFTL